MPKVNYSEKKVHLAILDYQCTLLETFTSVMLLVLCVTSIHVYVSIFGPARPAHRPYWTGVGRDLEAHGKFFWTEPDPKCCF
jgi:hypothetical protein